MKTQPVHTEMSWWTVLGTNGEYTSANNLKSWVIKDSAFNDNQSV